MKGLRFVAIATLAAIAVGIFWYFSGSARVVLYGPFRCDACALASPIADQATLAFIEDWTAAAGIPSAGSFLEPRGGVTIMLCNEVGCVTYARTTNGGWRGTERS